MQSAWPQEFCVETLNLSVKRVSGRDAFGIEYRGPVVYGITKRTAKEKTTGPTWKSDDFFKAKTIEQLIAEQGISPIADVSIFAGVIPDEDIDEFVAEIYRGRDA
jgi:hypothetical protein